MLLPASFLALAPLVGALFLLAAAPLAAQTFDSITERARAAEDPSASLTITLSEDVPNAGAAFTVASGFGGSSTAEPADVMSIDSPVTIPSGTRSPSNAIPLTDDDMDEDEETFTAIVATTAEGWMKEGDDKDAAVVAIDDDDKAGVNFIGVETISDKQGRPKIGLLTVYQNTPATYQVVLTSRPVADVTVNVTGLWVTVSPASHTFAASSENDWREPKQFTVTAGGRIGSANIVHTVTTSDPDYSTLQYSDWSHNSDKLNLDIRPPLPTRLTLRADPLPAEGGGTVRVTATMDNPAPRGGTTVRLTTSGTAAGEGSDYTLSSTTISIGVGQTTGTATITVTDDSADDDDETIVLEASSSNPDLPSIRLTLTIEDNDGDGTTPTTPKVSLAASPNPVTEGSPVTVTARLSSALSSEVTIPLTVTAGTAEPGDFGALASITIAGGSTTGTGTVTTNQDTDTADETFTVALGNLPSSVAAGSPSLVEVRIRDNDDDGGGTTPTTPKVSLAASPNPVMEGSPVTVTARLSSALSSEVTIPLTVTAGTAEPGDFGALASITIAGGSTTGTGTVTTNQDTDAADETFTVALGNLPSSVAAGSPSLVEVRIRDNDDGGGGTTPTTPKVSLAASPNPVTEGSPVTVTARLSSALSRNVTIPLTVTAGTAEPGDFGALASITIAGGSTTGTGMVTTHLDTDAADETFTVALGNLPSSVAAGSPWAVEVTVADPDFGNGEPTVSASCDPCRVGPGGAVRLTARASDPDGDPLTYAWSAPAGRFAGPADEAAARWRAPAETGRVTIRVQVSDGQGGTASATVSIEVANGPPAFGEPSYTFELRENEDGRGRPVPLGAAVAEDPDGDELEYALVSGAEHLFVVGGGGGDVCWSGRGLRDGAEPARVDDERP